MAGTMGRARFDSYIAVSRPLSGPVSVAGAMSGEDGR